MVDRRFLTERMEAAGLLERPLGTLGDGELRSLCRLMLEAHVRALPDEAERRFFCSYGRPAGRNAVLCLANLHAAGVSAVPARRYGVPLAYCLQYCEFGKAPRNRPFAAGERSGETPFRTERGRSGATGGRREPV